MARGVKAEATGSSHARAVCSNPARAKASSRLAVSSAPSREAAASTSASGLGKALSSVATSWAGEDFTRSAACAADQPAAISVDIRRNRAMAASS